jgi:hypothetical protein
MKIFVLALTLLATISALANENPAPTNVGVYNFSTYSPTTASVQIIARNPNRAYLLIQNQGNASVIVKPDAFQSASEGIILAPQSSYEPHPALVDSFYAKSNSGTQTLLMIEGVK